MPEIADHLYKILIIGGSWSGKTNLLLNLINNELDIDKSYLCTKDPYGAKYQLWINKKKSTGKNCLNYFQSFVEHSNDMDDIH